MSTFFESDSYFLKVEVDVFWHFQALLIKTIVCLFTGVKEHSSLTRKQKKNVKENFNKNDDEDDDIQICVQAVPFTCLSFCQSRIVISTWIR